MRRAWVSVAAAALLCACGTGGSWRAVDGTAGGGLELTLIAAAVSDRSFPAERPAAGTHCFTYVLHARSVDSGRHELRPDQFQAGGGTALDAVGQCAGPQMEPTWVGGSPRTLRITVLAKENASPPLLMWRTARW
jgi:hypothetical protein